MANDIVKRCIVYGLRSSSSPEIRYIGQTKRLLRHRLMSHVSSARRGGRTYRDNWIRSILLSGDAIEIVILVEHAEWSKTEVELIAKYRSDGARLVNTTSGGDGVRDLPAEVKSRISAKARGRKLSAEHRALMSARRRGVPLSPEHREKMVAGIQKAYAERGEEISRRLSAARMGHAVSQVTRDRIGAANIGRQRSVVERERISLAGRIRFSDPTQRELTSRATRAAMSRPEVKQRLLDSMARRWGDITQRAAQAERAKQTFGTPEGRAAQAGRRAKVTDSQVIEARALRKQGASLKELCDRYGIAMGPMSMLCNGKTFKHLPL